MCRADLQEWIREKTEIFSSTPHYKLSVEPTTYFQGSTLWACAAALGSLHGAAHARKPLKFALQRSVSRTRCVG
jgi:hypothetical protein